MEASRRDFLRTTAAAGAAASMGIAPFTDASAAGSADPLFKISVAEYSLHRMIASGELDPLDYGPYCKEKFGVDAVEYWMGPFKDKGKDKAYLGDMHQRSVDAGVEQLLIMVDIHDGTGRLGNPDEAARQKAAEAHYPWVEAAKMMGCHSIRVNAQSEGSREEQQKLVADGLRKLSEFAAPHDINIIVENHGGYSSDGAWLAGVMQIVDLPNCGTLPDFGNFRIRDDQWYDRYQGVEELMPYAKAVSSKSRKFDESGNETQTDFAKMMGIVMDAGYRGYVGIEWEGRDIPEVDGVLLTKKLLEQVRDSLSAPA
ncbi:MAG: sugar phosphate isomerase/epimerase family protein [Planctomycetota bacterium]